MNPSLRLAKQLKRVTCMRLHRIGDWRLINNSEDGGKGSMRLMHVLMLVIVRVNRPIRMPVLVGMRVSRAMLICVRMRMRRLRMNVLVKMARFAMRMIVCGCDHRSQ